MTHDSHEEGYRYQQPQACIDELRKALKAALKDIGEKDPIYMDTHWPSVPVARATLERTR